MQVGIELLRDGIKAKEHAERWGSSSDNCGMGTSQSSEVNTFTKHTTFYHSRQNAAQIVWRHWCSPIWFEPDSGSDLLICINCFAWPPERESFVRWPAIRFHKKSCRDLQSHWNSVLHAPIVNYRSATGFWALQTVQMVAQWEILRFHPIRLGEGVGHNWYQKSSNASIVQTSRWCSLYSVCRWLEILHSHSTRRG